MTSPLLPDGNECPDLWADFVGDSAAPPVKPRAPERLSSPAEVRIDGVYLTQISGRWCRVRVVCQRPDGRFDVVREPGGGRLNPRAWTQLRRERAGSTS